MRECVGVRTHSACHKAHISRTESDDPPCPARDASGTGPDRSTGWLACCCCSTAVAAPVPSVSWQNERRFWVSIPKSGRGIFFAFNKSIKRTVHGTVELHIMPCMRATCQKRDDTRGARRSTKEQGERMDCTALCLNLLHQTLCKQHAIARLPLCERKRRPRCFKRSVVPSLSW